jgi:hypothetical protein
VVGDTGIPVVTDNLFAGANDVPVEADKTEGVTEESRVVTDRTFVDTNDVAVEVDILPVVRTNAGEGTNKTDLATHFVPVVIDSIKEGTAKTCIETTNPPLETTRVCPVTAPLWIDAPQIRVGSASLPAATTGTGVEARGTRVATVEPL